MISVQKPVGYQQRSPLAKTGHLSKLGLALRKNGGDFHGDFPIFTPPKGCRKNGKNVWAFQCAENMFLVGPRKWISQGAQHQRVQFVGNDFAFVG